MRKKILWLEPRDALVLHERLLALDGGRPGVRDAALLESALARPHHLHTYGDHPDLVNLAAAYIVGIVRNHPFFDGNKRTGFLVGVVFLELNGARFSASEESAAQAILDLAAGSLAEDSFASWLRSVTDIPAK
jgi:death on curing protein